MDGGVSQAHGHERRRKLLASKPCMSFREEILILKAEAPRGKRKRKRQIPKLNYTKGFNQNFV